MTKNKVYIKILDFLKKSSKITIRDKSGTFIGARMGRPEKSKLRKLTGSPHVLFPVGEEGGRLRSFQAALEANDDIVKHLDAAERKRCIDPKVHTKHVDTIFKRVGL
mgnify:CR=1 FL=1